MRINLKKKYFYIFLNEIENKENFLIRENEMHKRNNDIIIECINVTIVNKYLIQKKTYTNMLKFIQISKEIKKLQIDRRK